MDTQQIQEESKKKSRKCVDKENSINSVDQAYKTYHINCSSIISIVSKKSYKPISDFTGKH